MNDANPLLTESGLPCGAPDFVKIKPGDYMPAFEKAIEEAKKEIDSIASDSREPDFCNTVEAMEKSGALLDKVSNLFFNIKEADTSPEMERTAEAVTPMLTEFSLHVSMNEKLFCRVKAVYDNRKALSLDKEGEMLLEKTYKSFARNGAELKGEARKKYGEIEEKLSLAVLKYGQNALSGQNAYSMNITDESELDGLPEYVKEAAAEEACSKGKSGWLFTLHAPSYGPFMKYAANRDLRKRMWMAYNTISVSGDYDNREIVRNIVNLRLEKARLLSYGTHADYVLEENMAKDKETVNGFLSGLVERTMPFANEEFGLIEDFAHGKGLEGELMPWDFPYYSEMYRHEKFDLNDELLKPYFSLESVQDAVFGLAGRLYGISIRPAAGIPAYHNDVRVFEMTDNDGSFLALLYMDYFPRESKRSGAWMTEFRGTSVDGGKEKRPFISLVFNFTKPSSKKPSLLSFSEVTTFLHEFGHALHGAFAKGRYASLTGTNVARDFVELPSQLMENWAYVPEYLNSFARHYRTGEKIPSEYVDRIIRSRNFLSGYYQARQLSFGLQDMAWHCISEPFEGDVLEFERKAVEPARVLPSVDGTSVATNFNHIFAGGYSAGYYSYKWAEALEADAFSLFLENGVFDRATAASFRENILSKGGIEDAGVLYRRFRGRDPQPDALMEKLGLVR